ncbi:recombinase RecT [Acinetobacter ursingii]|uniref:recombinase RecT n=1 Tax=Acinetobacter ursingii TaxID=108980 RepID=UPI00244D574E|nr:recombinase RecT [Acinetobacter ursingii]MDG9859409.1 recombinase RecT [Acinetobacter ursingii]MDG9895569.1 recombinase RecT [Acinetobacter ursingii]MDH0006597.1 recombinase RecT [Acinetobacter ursingii]MDH0478416.1 recombinase RecT [Acinetobacter ursingii]MDH2118967.1 recombinase RecT [Acinetobacter ursingii]
MNTVANIQPQQSIGLLNLEAFELSQRIAKMLSSSTLVPEQYRQTIKVKAGKDNFGNMLYRDEPNPNGLANCVIALNMASRLNADPLMVMQNLYLIEGRPSWSSQFIMAAINSCGRFSALRFELEDLGEKEVEYSETVWENRNKKTVHKKITINNMSCVAFAVERETGERIESSKITMEMAVKEGWYQKNGSKWQTMPEQMLRYRAASFFGRVYAPELLMGLRSSEEEQERIIDVTPETVVASASNFNELKSKILKAKTDDEMAEIESQIYEVMDDKERNKLIELWKSKSKKSVKEETAKTTEDASHEPDPVVEQEEVKVVDTSRSPELRKKYIHELNNAKTEKELAVLSQAIEAEIGLTDTHQKYLNSVVQGCYETLSKQSSNQTQDEDMFADVQQIPYVDAVILRIQNAKNQDEINAEYADPAIEELSDAERKRIDDAASQRENELFGN